MLNSLNTDLKTDISNHASKSVNCITLDDLNNYKLTIKNEVNLFQTNLKEMKVFYNKLQEKPENILSKKGPTQFTFFKDFRKKSEKNIDLNRTESDKPKITKRNNSFDCIQIMKKSIITSTYNDICDKIDGIMYKLEVHGLKGYCPNLLEQLIDSPSNISIYNIYKMSPKLQHDINFVINTRYVINFLSHNY